MLTKVTMLMSNTENNKVMSAEERRRLILRPFPIVKMSSPRGNSQAPDWAKTKQDNIDADGRYDYDDN